MKEAFKFSDSSLFVPVVFCFGVIFGVQNVRVPLGCGEDVCIRLGVKKIVVLESKKRIRSKEP